MRDALEHNEATRERVLEAASRLFRGATSLPWASRRS